MAFTFAQSESSGVHQLIAISGDGLIAYTRNSNTGYVKKTIDGGISWTNTAMPTSSVVGYNALSCSNNGQTVCLVGSSGTVLISNDGGATYTNKAPFIRYWMGCRVSGNGQIITLVASSPDSHLMASSDNGNTWWQSPTIWEPPFQRINYDGSVIIVADTTNGLSICNNFPTNKTFVNKYASGVYSYTIDNSGTKIAIGLITNPGPDIKNGIRISTDSGNTWNLPVGNIGAGATLTRSISMSGDGQTIIAEQTNGLYYTQDGGLTWNQNTQVPASGLSIVEVSDNGLAAISATGQNGSVGYVWYGTGTPILPVIDISTLQSSKLEGNYGTTELSFTISRSGITTGDSAVTWNVINGSTSNDDFQGGILQSGITIFADGETSKIITIYINGDETVESTETFTVNLSAPNNATLGVTSATGTILNDDSVQPITLKVSLKSFDLTINPTNNRKLDDEVQTVSSGNTITFPTPPSTTNLVLVTGSNCLVPNHLLAISNLAISNPNSVATITQLENDTYVGGSGKTIYIGNTFVSLYEPNILYRKDNGPNNEGTTLDNIRIGTITAKVEDSFNLDMEKEVYGITSVESHTADVLPTGDIRDLPNYSGTWSFYFKDSLKNAKMTFKMGSHLDTKIIQFTWQGQYHQIANKLGGR